MTTDVALPRAAGRMLPEWKQSGAVIHVVDLDIPAASLWRLPRIHASARKIVEEVTPDLIHSHHMSTTVVLRQALGRDHPAPRIFQVPGPLHLEHALFRRWEIGTAGARDWWIPTSRCIAGHYLRAGIARDRLFLSYAGTHVTNYSSHRTYTFRRSLGIADDQLVVGNISYIYAPKYYLGQTVGLKGHEDIIDALAIVTAKRADVVGVLAGGAWDSAGAYERKLRARAGRVGVRMPGYLPPDVIENAWADFDCAVHVPLSENCGGVIEPLLAAVPTIAGNVGGLPEVVIDGVTGKLVPARRPNELAEAILEVLSARDRYVQLARAGQRLVRTMFDVSRTAGEVYDIYRHLCDPTVAPPPTFDSRGWAG